MASVSMIPALEGILKSTDNTLLGIIKEGAYSYYDDPSLYVFDQYDNAREYRTISAMQDIFSHLTIVLHSDLRRTSVWTRRPLGDEQGWTKFQSPGKTKAKS